MKQVIITIDAEGHKGSDPVEHLIWGKTSDGNEYGINRIMDICDSFSAKILFFVDLAAGWDYGQDKIAEVIRHIRGRGHDVGVHIHPDHMADRNRLFLWEYSKEEQYEIIKNCTACYKEITGELPVAFRAGKYGANKDTLDILDEFKYKYDFSQFYNQQWCGFKPPICITLPYKYKNLFEIPVTVFKSMQFGKFIRYDKVDAVMDSSEYKHVMGRIAADKRDIVVSLFYHSFSMLDWRKNPDNPIPNLKEEKKFMKALEYVHESKEFKFISLSELENTCKRTNFNHTVDTEEKIIQTNGVIKSIWYSLKRIYGIRQYNRKAKWLVRGLLFVFVLIVAISLLPFFNV